MNNEKAFAVGMHLSCLLSFLYPYTGLVVAIILWLSKRNLSTYLNETGKEAINFQITFNLSLLCIGFSFSHMNFLSQILYLPAKGLLFLLANLGAFFFSVMGAAQAGRGFIYKYPLSLRFF
jgi:hypothetical protein